MKETTLLEQAVVEMKLIKEAAEKNALDKLAKAMPKEFDKFLKEELSKKENIQESTSVGNKKRITKVNESMLDMPQESSVEEGWANEESSNQPLQVDTDVNASNDCGCDDENGEVLDMTGLTLDDVEQAYDDASSDDEIKLVKDAGASDASAEGDELDQDAVMNDIESELSQMGSEGGEEEIVTVDDEPVEEGNAEQVSDPFEIMKKMHGELTSAISAIEEKLSVESHSKEFDGKMMEVYGEGCKEAFGEQKYNEMFDVYKKRKMDEMHKGNLGKETIAKAHNGNLGKGTVTETEVVKEDSEVEPTGTETEIEEAHGVTLANNKQVSGNQTPSLDHKQYAKDKVRSALQTEAEKKKFNALLEENKKLSKKINESKKVVTDLSSTLNEYKGALDKYRKQLSEMAVFNNNLAHVNNILVNESLALTGKEKKRIIERFKGVSSLEESEKTYKAVLSDLSSDKKNITESIESKISNVVESSSADRLGKVVENTAYMNEHVSKIKNLMNYVDKRK